jgi:hypothetical protein
MAWSRKFDEPIPLPNGQELRTLSEAANYIIALPPEIFALADWQVAIEALGQVSEASPTTLARIAFLKALNSKCSRTYPNAAN